MRGLRSYHGKLQDQNYLKISGCGLPIKLAVYWILDHIINIISYLEPNTISTPQVNEQNALPVSVSVFFTLPRFKPVNEAVTFIVSDPSRGEKKDKQFLLAYEYDKEGLFLHALGLTRISTAI